MAEKNFWDLLGQVAKKLQVDQRTTLDVKMDHILDDLAGYAPAKRTDMRETLAVVIARLAILQVRLPPKSN